MTSLRWIADGIEAAERAGGVVLGKRRRAGFTGDVEVRPRPESELHLQGFETASDPEPWEYEGDE